MDIIEKWDSMYIRATEGCCIICGKPAQYVDIFTEQRICSKECAMKHDKIINDLMERVEKNTIACSE